jgi:hypothetical protein
VKNKKFQKLLLKIPFYQQTLPTSCGAACLLMVGNFFYPEKFPLTREKELEIHEKIKYWDGDEYGEFANVAKMIRYMRENGFQIRYFLEIAPTLFNPPPDFEKGLWEKYVNSFLEVLNQEKEKGLEVINSCDLRLLIQEILLGKPVIAEVQCSGYITHLIVIRGIKGNMIHFLDPLEKSGYRKEHKSWLKENLKLKVGKNFFSLSPIKNSDDNSNI